MYLKLKIKIYLSALIFFNILPFSSTSYARDYSNDFRDKANSYALDTGSKRIMAAYNANQKATIAKQKIENVNLRHFFYQWTPAMCEQKIDTAKDNIAAIKQDYNHYQKVQNTRNQFISIIKNGSQGYFPQAVKTMEKIINNQQIDGILRKPTKDENRLINKWFPNMKIFIITREVDWEYNCISKSIDKFNKWTWPGCTITDFDNLYNKAGYSVTTNKSQAQIVLFTNDDGKPTHAAIRIPGTNYWESKLGSSYQILHKLPDMEGRNYGKVTRYYAKDSN